MTVAGESVVVGRHIRDPRLEYTTVQPVSVEVRRQLCRIREHRGRDCSMHWWVWVVWYGKSDKNESCMPTYYDHASGANETAGNFAIEHRLYWDRAAFPHGLVR